MSSTLSRALVGLCALATLLSIGISLHAVWVQQLAAEQLTHMQREAARMERALARMPVQLTMPCHVPACEG